MLRKINLWVRTHGVQIGIFIIVMTFSGILLLQAYSISQVIQGNNQNYQIIQQLNDLTARLVKNGITRTDQINGIDKHLDCVAAFLSQPYRINTSISDIEKCQLLNTKTGIITNAK